MNRRQTTRSFKVRNPTKRSFLSRIFRLGIFLALTGAVAGGALAVSIYTYYAPTVPEFHSIDDYQPRVGSRIYSLDNQLIGEFAEERRVLVPVEKIPIQLFNAFISAEDKRFRTHMGVDILGVMQAIFDKIRKPGSKLRGASTISQQVAKSVLVAYESYESATERSLVRKIREAILALRLEAVLTKDQILYMYVNEIFLGHKAYGVQAAAEHYFRKNVWELSIAEMATFAGLPQRPSDYSPFSRPEAAYARRKYVLRRMKAEGYINQEEHDTALAEELTVYPRRELYLEVAPYFTEHIRRELVHRYGERAVLEEGLQVYTTLNTEYQKAAQVAVNKGLHDLDERQGFRGPLAHLLTKEIREEFRAASRIELGLIEGQPLELNANQTYVAQVTGFTKKGRQAKIDVAGLSGFLPLAGMRWARTPDPTQRWDGHYVRDTRRALKVGDVITVKTTTRKALSRDTHGWEVLDTVPKKGKIFRLVQQPIAQGSLMSVDPKTGYVVALIGGYHFEESSFNRAIQACREPGSAFKPVVYSAAIDKLDYTPSTLIDDKPFIRTDDNLRWKPNNAGQQFRGQLPMRTCLQDSINTPALRIADAVGIRDILRNAKRFGMKEKFYDTPDCRVENPPEECRFCFFKPELGTALGSSATTMEELIKIYVVLNQYGERRELKYIRRVVDRYGTVLEDKSAPTDATSDFGTRLDRAYQGFAQPTERTLDPASAFVMVSLLENVVESGTGIGATALGVPVAGKTGTTNDSYDAWFMAFTKNLVTGVWVGHDTKERPLGSGEFGGRTALPIWLKYMDKALRDYRRSGSPRLAEGSFTPPPGVVRVNIDPETGLLARPESARVATEYYRAGTEPVDFTPDQVVLDPNEMDLFGADTPL